VTHEPPHHSLAWTLEHKTRLRRASLSLTLFGILTGIGVRCYRWFVLAVLAPQSPGYIILTIVAGVAILCALVTVHLANFPLRAWRWRAPLLGAYIAAGEALMSLLLTMAHQERLGRTLATPGDWAGSLPTLFVSRLIVVSLYALLLAGAFTALTKRKDSEEIEKRG
jgi:hypothetical protein